MTNELEEVSHIAKAIFDEVSKVVIGKTDIINYLTISLLSEGNILM